MISVRPAVSGPASLEAADFPRLSRSVVRTKCGFGASGAGLARRGCPGLTSGGGRPFRKPPIRGHVTKRSRHGNSRRSFPNHPNPGGSPTRICRGPTLPETVILRDAGANAKTRQGQAGPLPCPPWQEKSETVPLCPAALTADH